MPITKLKSCPQELWLGNKGYSSEGICYYMSKYVESICWDSAKVKSFSDVETAAKKSIPATIIKWAKARNLQEKAGEAHGTPQDSMAHYNAVNGSLNTNSIYRIALWFGNNTAAPANNSSVNHEAIVCTGTGSTSIFFEPNFGFYKISSSTLNNRAALEHYVNNLYGANSYATNFQYRRKRSVS